jgi:hypothetical protein
MVYVFNLGLLGFYLDPQNGNEPMFTAAVQLLHNQRRCQFGLFASFGGIIIASMLLDSFRILFLFSDMKYHEGSCLYSKFWVLPAFIL